MYNCRKIRHYMIIVMDTCKVIGGDCRFECTYRLLQLLCTHQSLYSYTKELATILQAENSIRVVRLLYIAVYSQNLQGFVY